MGFLRTKRLWVFALLFVTGCGAKTTASGTVPVTGTVTYQGRPVEGANVVFQSLERGSFGVTDPQGRFHLQTFAPGDGAVPGEYQVSITKVQITVPEFDEGHPQYVPPPPPKQLVPIKYGDARTSGLTASVVQGQKNDFAFALQD